MTGTLHECLFELKFVARFVALDFKEDLKGFFVIPTFLGRYH